MKYHDRCDSVMGYSTQTLVDTRMSASVRAWALDVNLHAGTGQTP